MKSIQTNQIHDLPVFPEENSVAGCHTKILQFSSQAIFSDLGFHDDTIPQKNEACGIRIFSIKKQWKEILAACSDPDLKMIISKNSVLRNMMVKDCIDASPPVSFPGKLLAI